MNRFLTSNGIKDHLVTTEQHFVIKHASKEFRSGCTLDSLVAVLRIEDMCCTHASSLLNLERVASHHAHFCTGDKGANNLQGEQTDGACTYDENMFTGLWEAAQNSVN